MTTLTPPPDLPSRGGARRHGRYSKQHKQRRLPVLSALGVLLITVALLGGAVTTESSPGQRAALPNPGDGVAIEVARTDAAQVRPAAVPAARRKHRESRTATAVKRPASMAATPASVRPTTATTTTPTPPPAAAGGAATTGGLGWRSGVTVGLPEVAAEWGRWRGRPVDVVHAYTERSSWSTIESAGWVLGYYRDNPAALVISQPFWPDGPGGNMQACGRGDYDAHWKAYGRALVAAGRTDAYTRLAWEFNGNWFSWSATDVTAWKTCFRRVVSAVRSTAPSARFEWNLNAHTSHTSDGDAWKSYPGDDVVDVVGIDAYDHWPASRTPAEFATQCRGNEGLCTVMSFARSHDKKVGVSEWGVIRSGIGDNPVYIEQMFATFQANKDVMAYETYFNDSEFVTSLHAPEQNPRSAARYAALFGQR